MATQKSYCRACMVDNPRNIINMRDLYTSQNDEKVSFMDMFYQITDIRIEKDNFSRMLCQPCTNALRFAYEFRKQSQLTHSMLVQKVPETNQLIEIVEIAHDESPIKTEMVDVQYQMPGPGCEFEDESLPKPEAESPGCYEPEYLSGDEEMDTETQQAAGADSSTENKKKRSRNDWRGYFCISSSCRKLFRSSKEMRNHLNAFKGKLSIFFAFSLRNRQIIWAMFGKIFTRH